MSLFSTIPRTAKIIFGVSIAALTAHGGRILYRNYHQHDVEKTRELGKIVSTTNADMHDKLTQYCISCIGRYGNDTPPISNNYMDGCRDGVVSRPDWVDEVEYKYYVKIEGKWSKGKFIAWRDAQKN